MLLFRIMTYQSLRTLGPIMATGAMVLTTSAQGTISYHNEGAIPVFSDGVTGAGRELDLDGNGTVDYSVIAAFGFWIVPADLNEVVGRPEGGFDLGSYVWPLGAQENISSLVPAPLQWTGTETYVSPGGSTSLIYPAFHLRSTSGTDGPWQSGVDAYIGVSFLIDDQTHYGWINLEIPDNRLNGGVIHDWAYNTVPGEMILAGQVPEPSTWALLIAGGALLWWRYRRKEQGIA
jgi:hypothetical protein